MSDLQRLTECNVFRTQFSKGALTVRRIQGGMVSQKEKALNVFVLDEEY